MCGSMIDIQFVTAEIRQGKKKDRKKKPHDKNIMSASATQVAIHNDNATVFLSLFRVVICLAVLLLLVQLMYL